jgi:lipopolysaccharide transport system ATP-binding protein
VLFVSHNMAAVEALCKRCLMFSEGALVAHGDTTSVILRNVAQSAAPGSGAADLTAHPGRRSGDTPTMTRVELASGAGHATGTIRIGDPMEIRVSYRAARPLRPVLGSAIKTSYGTPVFSVSDRFCSQLAECEPRAEATIVCRIERLMLIPGNYSIDLWLGDARRDFDVIYDAIGLEVLPADLTGTGRLPPPNIGSVFCEATWRFAEE